MHELDPKPDKSSDLPPACSSRVTVPRRANGNQAVHATPEARADGTGTGLTATDSRRFSHDFRRISLRPRAGSMVQAKLRINAPGDVYEQEADRVAEQVVSTPEPQMRLAPAYGRESPECPTEDQHHGPERLRTKRVQAGKTVQTLAPPIIQEVLAAPGQALHPAARAYMEPRFDHSFADIRVHADVAAGESARAIGALAYASGTHVVFAPGQFTLGSERGLRVLAHELAHVVQQASNTGTIIQRDYREMGEVPMTHELPENPGPVEIHVVDRRVDEEYPWTHKYAGPWTWYALGGSYVTRNVEMTSVESMVDNIIAYAAGRQIRKLTISDHTWEFGDDTVTLQTLRDWEPKLESLRPHFTADAEVRLDHCKLARHDLPIVCRLAATLGATVYATFGNVFLPGMSTGSWMRCSPAGHMDMFVSPP